MLLSSVALTTSWSNVQWVNQNYGNWLPSNFAYGIIVVIWCRKNDWYQCYPSDAICGKILFSETGTITCKSLSMIQIWCKILFVLIPFQHIILHQNFAHAMTAQLSWYVPNFVTNPVLFLLRAKQFPLNFNYIGKIVSAMGTMCPFYYYGLTFTTTWISNYTCYRVWYEITYPFSNINGKTIEVWEWISNFIPHFTGHVITYTC